MPQDRGPSMGQLSAPSGIKVTFLEYWAPGSGCSWPLPGVMELSCCGLAGLGLPTTSRMKQECRRLERPGDGPPDT